MIGSKALWAAVQQDQYLKSKILKKVTVWPTYV